MLVGVTGPESLSEPCVYEYSLSNSPLSRYFYPAHSGFAETRVALVVW